MSRGKKSLVKYKNKQDQIKNASVQLFSKSLLAQSYISKSSIFVTINAHEKIIFEDEKLKHVSDKAAKWREI